MKAIFFITSPLQALSTIDAINYYKIEDAKVLVQSGQPRLQQIENVLIKHSINYEVLPSLTAVKKIILLLKALISRQKYDYLFIGSYRFFVAKFIYCHYIKRGGQIIHIDDGNYIIPLFKYGVMLKHRHHRLEQKLTDIVLVLRNITQNIFFTNYADLKNDCYKIEYNPGLSIAKINFADSETIYFIGTSQTYPFDLGVEDDYLNIMQECFDRIKKIYPGKKTVYLPHGNDDNIDIKNLCLENQIEYFRPDTCVELFLIDKKIKPFAVFGFASSAQYTIKKWFPSTPNYVFWFGGLKNTEEYLLVNAYLQKIGVEIIDYTK